MFEFLAILIKIGNIIIQYTYYVAKYNSGTFCFDFNHTFHIFLQVKCYDKPKRKTLETIENVELCIVTIFTDWYRYHNHSLKFWAEHSEYKNEVSVTWCHQACFCSFSNNASFAAVFSRSPSFGSHRNQSQQCNPQYVQQWWLHSQYWMSRKTNWPFHCK